MKIKYAKDKDGNKITFRQASDGEWVEVNKEFNAIDTTGTSAQELTNTKAAKKPLGLAKAKGHAAVERLKEARAMGSIDEYMLHLGQKLDKMGAGTAELYDVTKGITGMVTGIDSLDESSMASINKRAIEQAEKDTLFEEATDTRGIPGFAGAVTPYIWSEIATGPLARAASTKALNKIGNVIKTVGKEGGSKIQRGLEHLGKLEIPGVTPAAKSIKSTYADPIKTYVSGIAKRPPLRLANVKKTTADIIGGTATGALEGLVEYGDSVMNAATSSLYGGAVGNTLNPLLAKIPNQLTSSQRETSKWMHDVGYRQMPGMLTGNPTFQTFESGMRNSDRWGPAVKDLDMANDVALDRVAYEAMGIPEKEATEMTARKFGEHLNDLSAEYKEKVGGIQGIFDKPEYQQLHHTVGKLKEDKTRSGKRAYIDAKEYLNRIVNKSNPTIRDDEFIQTRLKGKDYQKIRTDIKADLDKAYSKTDKKRIHALQPIIGAMDGAIDKGAEATGKFTSKEWRDLNERNAMTSLLIDNGLDVHHRLDKGKLANSLESTDMKRLLAGKGGRIHPLHMIAKVAEMEKDQAGSTLTSMGIHAKSRLDDSLTARLLLPKSDNSAVKKAMFWLYRNDFSPASRGLLNMNREGFYKPSTFARSIHQETDFAPDTIKAIRGAYDNPKKTFDKAKKGVENWWESE